MISAKPQPLLSATRRTFFPIGGEAAHRTLSTCSVGLPPLRLRTSFADFAIAIFTSLYIMIVVDRVLRWEIGDLTC
jgi:hypothetical protein